MQKEEKFHHPDFLFNPESHCVVKLFNSQMPESRLDKELGDLFPVLEALKFFI
jgi:hypothetical protein